MAAMTKMGMRRLYETITETDVEAIDNQKWRETGNGWRGEPSLSGQGDDIEVRSPTCAINDSGKFGKNKNGDLNFKWLSKRLRGWEAAMSHW